MSNTELEKYNRSSMNNELMALEALRDMYDEMLETATEEERPDNQLIVDALNDAINSLSLHEATISQGMKKDEPEFKDGHDIKGRPCDILYGNNGINIIIGTEPYYAIGTEFVQANSPLTVAAMNEIATEIYEHKDNYNLKNDVSLIQVREAVYREVSQEVDIESSDERFYNMLEGFYNETEILKEDAADIDIEEI